jgi:hypothetical protein
MPARLQRRRAVRYEGTQCFAAVRPPTHGGRRLGPPNPRCSFKAIVATVTVAGVPLPNLNEPLRPVCVRMFEDPAGRAAPTSGRTELSNELICRWSRRGDPLARSEQPPAASHHQEGLVQAERFDRRPEQYEDSSDLTADPRVSAPTAWVRTFLPRTEPTCRHHWHGAADTDGAGLEEVAQITPRQPNHPTMTSCRCSLGWAYCSTDAGNVPCSTWRLVILWSVTASPPLSIDVAAR